jgi:hypothetical protein
MAVLAVLVGLAGGAVACGDDGVPTGSPRATTTKPPSTSTTKGKPADEDPGNPPDVGSSAPPKVTVQGAGDPIELTAWTFCYSSMCADGAPPAIPPDVGATGEVAVSFPLDDWTFEADFVPVGQDCPRHHALPLTRGDDGGWVVKPAGNPGTYDVTLSGRGQGDLFVTFRWTTTEQGPQPVPSARMAVVADHDGAMDSYGVELSLANLAATPTEASATITVTSREGRSHRFVATRAAGCQAEGSVNWNGPAEDGKAAAALGTAPFTYEVEVVLDGQRHVARATWPDDVVAGEEPSVALTFDPPLPALE